MPSQDRLIQIGGRVNTFQPLIKSHNITHLVLQIKARYAFSLGYFSAAILPSSPVKRIEISIRAKYGV